MKTPKVAHLVCYAINNLRDRQGSTQKDILNYIISEYKENDPTIKRKTIAALKRGLDHGYLKKSGRFYFLNNDIWSLQNPQNTQKSDCDAMPMKSKRKGRSRSSCGPMKRKKSRSKRKRSKSASCGTMHKKKSRSSSRRKSRRKHGRSRSKRGRRSRRASSKGRSRSHRHRRKSKRSSRGKKCAPMAPDNDNSFQSIPDNIITKAASNDYQMFDEIEEVKPTIGRSNSRPRSSHSQAVSRSGSKARSTSKARSQRSYVN